MQLRSDDAKPASDARRTLAYLGLSRHIVKMQPLPVFAGYDPFGAQHLPIGSAIQGGKHMGQIFRVICTDGLHSPAGKYLVRIMAMVMAAGTDAILVIMMHMAVVMAVVMVMVMVVVMAMLVVMVMAMLVVMVMVQMFRSQGGKGLG